MGNESKSHSTNLELGLVLFAPSLALYKAAMRTAARVVQNAPPDTLLYNEALLTIKQLSSDQQAFLLTIATTSTHLPYTHPENCPDTPEAVWEWSLQQRTRNDSKRQAGSAISPDSE